MGRDYFNADIGLMKNFHFTESKYFQFRADFLNAFNNVNLGHPDTNFSTTSTHSVRSGLRSAHPLRNQPGTFSSRLSCTSRRLLNSGADAVASAPFFIYAYIL